MLIGEGKYNLDALKEVKVTESFLGLDMNYCQNVEPIQECEGRHYKNSLLQHCGCLPLRIAIYKNVSIRGKNIQMITKICIV